VAQSAVGFATAMHGTTTAHGFHCHHEMTGARSTHLMRIYLNSDVALGSVAARAWSIFGSSIQGFFPTVRSPRVISSASRPVGTSYTAGQGLAISVSGHVALYRAAPNGTSRRHPSKPNAPREAETKPSWRSRLLASSRIDFGQHRYRGWHWGNRESSLVETQNDIWKTGA